MVTLQLVFARPLPNSMRLARFRRWKAAGVIGLLVAVGIYFACRKADPKFRGVPVSRHLLGFHDIHYYPQGVEYRSTNGFQDRSLKVTYQINSSDSVEALRAVGPQALPLIASYLGAQESTAGRLARTLKTKWPVLEKYLGKEPDIQ